MASQIEVSFFCHLILYALCRPEAIAKEALDLKFTLPQKKYIYIIVVFVTSNCLSMVNIMRRTAQLSYVGVYVCMYVCVCVYIYIYIYIYWVW